jgi:hypothetical protein
MTTRGRTHSWCAVLCGVLGCFPVTTSTEPSGSLADAGANEAGQAQDAAAPQDAATISDAATTPDAAGSDAAGVTDGGDMPADAGLSALPTCPSWAAGEDAMGIQAATGVNAAHRTNFQTAGGGLVAIDDTYFVAWFPNDFASASPKRIFVDLHGTSGVPEADWNDWHNHLAPRGWGFLGLSYWYASRAGTPEEYSDDPLIYDRLKRAIQTLKESCDVAGAKYYLAGFSRGSALTFPVVYADLQDEHLFTATLANAGAYHDASDRDFDETIRSVDDNNETTAFTGANYWMYCGEMDMNHCTDPATMLDCWTMCEEMEAARTFVTTYGGYVEHVWHNAEGDHASLRDTPEAIQHALNYFESL